MSITESSITRGHLRRILVLGLIVVCTLLAGAAGTMAYWSYAVDRMTAREEQALVARTIERRLEQMTENVVSASIWDDAWTHTTPRFDLDWVDMNFGQYYAEYMQHDRTVAFDREGRLAYVSIDGEMAGLDKAPAFVAALKPLLGRIAAEQAARHPPGKSAAAGLEAAITATTVVRAEGSVWLVAASNVAPENPALKTTAGAGPVVVSAKRVGPGFLTGLEKDLGVVGARLAPAGETLRGPAVPLRAATGETLGNLTWTPAQPGGDVFLDVAPLFGIALLLIFLAGGALAFRVVRALQTMAVNDRSLARTLEDLTVARDQAQAANVAKSQFLANISHEIRTPLNGVLGMAQIMKRGVLDDAQRDRLDIIQQSGVTLLALLNDVLDLAKIEAGKLEISRENLDLSETVQSLCGPFRAAALEKGLDFGFVVEPEAAGTSRLDGLRLSQVVRNLLSNAVKFTTEGHVSMRVWRSDRGLEFAVMDTGPGIPAERLEDLFGKFNQLDASTTRQFGGSGLGLAICRELVELMGGELAVESRVGHGSWFSFWLPADGGRTGDRIAA